MAEAHHLLDKDCLLLVVEACELRLALLLGKHRLLLGALCAFAGLGGFRRASLLRSVRGGRLRLRLWLWLWLWLSVLADAQHAGKYADDAADGASQHTANRPGRL